MFSTLHLAALETLTQPQPTICWPNLVGSYLATTHFRSAKSFSPQVALRLGCWCLITWHEKLCAIENQWGSINESATESATISAILSAPQHTEKNTQQWQQNTQNTMRAHFFTLFLPWFLCTFTGRHFCRWLLKNGLLFDLSEPSSKITVL